MSNKRQAYEDKIEAQLKEWSAELDLLSAKADKTKAEAKIEYFKTLETLQVKHDEAKTRLMEIRAASEDAWEDLKAGGEKAWADIKDAFSNAKSKF